MASVSVVVSIVLTRIAVMDLTLELCQGTGSFARLESRQGDLRRERVRQFDPGCGECATDSETESLSVIKK